MKTRFVSSQLFSSRCIFAGCRGVLIVATASLISVASPVLAQEGAYPLETTSRAAVSQETLDGLLAPIALYPDALLAQVLMAATYPLEVVEAARWQQENPDLDGQELQDALDSSDWDPSVKSLVTVPQVLHQMSDSPRWMRDLGRAVMDDQPRVMATVQMLRQKAYAAGALLSNDKQTVRVDTDTTHRVEYITIAPASTQVVYVPVYDTQVVYGTWWWPSRPVYWRPPPGVVLTTGYYWGPRYYPTIALWGSFNWGIGVITINAPIYHTYYRRVPPPMGPHNSWRRPPPPRGDYYQRPPPRSPYAGRPSGRDPRPPSYRPPNRSEPPSTVDRPRGNAPSYPRQTDRQPTRPEAPPSADRPRGNASDGPRQLGGQPLRSAPPSNAESPRGSAPSDSRQVGAQPLRSAPPSNAESPRGSAPSDSRQIGGRAISSGNNSQALQRSVAPSLSPNRRMDRANFRQGGGRALSDGR